MNPNENKLGKVFTKRNDPLSDEEWERMLQAEQDQLETDMRNQSIKHQRMKLKMQIKHAQEQLDKLDLNPDENSRKSYRNVL